MQINEMENVAGNESAQQKDMFADFQNLEIKSNEEQTYFTTTDRVMSVLTYMGLLILIPIVSGMWKKSELVKHHIKQALILDAVFIVLSIMLTVIYFSSIVETQAIDASQFTFIYEIVEKVKGISELGLRVFGIVYAIRCEMKYLPLIGKLFTRKQNQPN